MPAVEIGGGHVLLSRAWVGGLCVGWVVGRGGGGRCSAGPLFGMAGAAPYLCEYALQALSCLRSTASALPSSRRGGALSHLAEYSQLRLQFKCGGHWPARCVQPIQGPQPGQAGSCRGGAEHSRAQTAQTGVLFTGQRPALTDPVFLAAASELAQFDVLQPQSSMTCCAQQVR
jgi:hypothetical protein